MSSTLYGLRRHLGVVREGGAGAGCGVRVRVRDTCGANFARTPREIFCNFYENKNQFIVPHKNKHVGSKL